MKLAAPAHALLIVLIMTNPACSPSMPRPCIQQNPNPTKRYEITLTTTDAPGPFDAVTGFVQYKISNSQCMPLTPISGAALAPEHWVPLQLQRVSN